MRKFLGYVAPPHGGLWDVLLDEGTVVVRPDVTAGAADATTVAYLDQVGQVLSALPAQQLPPFGLVALAFAMTGRQTAVTDQLAEDIEMERGRFRGVMTVDARQLLLRLYRKLPERYRSGEERVRLLIVLLDEAHGKLSKRLSKATLGELKSWRAYDYEDVVLAPQFWSVGRDEYEARALSQTYRALDILMRRYGSLSAILAAADALPDLGEYDVSLEVLPEGAPSLHGLLGAVADAKRPLVEQLADNPHTAPLVRLLPQLQAGLRLSPALRASTELSIGAADLTNRGTVDRLLLSEHAYDRDTFTARVANNEALYLDREPPPTPSDEPATVAIDVTMPMWGTPRLLAYGLALAAQLRIGPTVNWILGEEARPVPTARNEDWVRALREQSLALRPDGGLRALLTDAERAPERLLLLTHPDFLRGLTFAAILREYPRLRLQVLTVDGLGQVESYAVTGASPRRTDSFRVDLSVLDHKAPRA